MPIIVFNIKKKFLQLYNNDTIKMLILGINVFHADTSAVFIKDGKVAYAAEEERFTRIKHFSGFPVTAINEGLKFLGLKSTDIDIVTMNYDLKYNFKEKVFFTLKNLHKTYVYSKLLSLKSRSSIDEIFLSQFKTKKEIKFLQIPHHKCHIASSYLASGFKESIGYSYDASGDFSTVESYILNNNNFTLLNKVNYPHSLGILYQMITQYLGFKNYGDEYKVMGLQSYGEPSLKKEIFKLIKKADGQDFKLNLNYFTHSNENLSFEFAYNKPTFPDFYSKKIFYLLGPNRKINEKLTKHHMNIAASLQAVFEDVVFEQLNYLYDKYKINNLCMAGGCAFNSVLNGKIKKRTGFRNIYIHSNAGDAGGALGAALIASSENDKNFKNVNISTSSFGNIYSSNDIEKNVVNYFKKNKLYNFEKFHHEDKLLDFVSEGLVEGKTIAWFSGRSEWGPRALGNRSILANPATPNIQNILNLQIKNREQFRPFAPIFIEDKLKDFFDLDEKIPFMNFVFHIEKNIEKVKGAIHADNSSRIQTVNKNQNERIYNLLNKFYIKTNIPCLINTSLNMNEPIVETPKNAFECFARTNLDFLVLEDYIVTKR